MEQAVKSVDNHTQLNNNGFLPEKDQIEAMELLNEEHCLGFSENLFDKAYESIENPAHGEPTISVWYPRLESPRLTISYAISMIRKVAGEVGDDVYQASALKSGLSNFKLYKESNHYVRSLCRFNININANCGKSVKSVRKTVKNPDRLLTSAGLWIYYHSPEFVCSMPQILFSGFQFKRNFNGFNDWKFVLSMRHCNNGKSELEFDSLSSDSSLRKMCVPVVESSLILTG